MKSHAILYGAILTVAAFPAWAQDHGGPAAHPAGGHAVMEANESMMSDMQAVQPTGDADKDFARMMIPHHQGAIDMAKAELQNGTDPELRQLAEEIIAAQEKEIAILEGWLARNAQ